MYFLEEVKQVKQGHNNNIWWNLKHSPRVLKSSYFKKSLDNFQKLVHARVLAVTFETQNPAIQKNKASNKGDSKNDYSTKYQRCIKNFVKHLWWSVFAKIFKYHRYLMPLNWLMCLITKKFNWDWYLTGNKFSLCKLWSIFY